MHTFLRHVSTKHYKSSGRLIKYKFRKLGFNASWNVEQLIKNLCQKGKYILFGAASNKSPSHKSLQKSIYGQTADEEKIEAWTKSKSIMTDHAVGVEVDDNMNVTIYDNGCAGGLRPFSIDNLVSRMRCINECYLLDLYEE